MDRRGKRVRRRLMCTVTCGISLATCSSVAWAQATPGHRLQLEATACKLISFIPEPGPGAWEAVAVQKSTLAALAKTGNKSLESVVRAYDEAALAENNKAMIRALDNGVKACHHLGLQTATQHQ